MAKLLVSLLLVSLAYVNADFGCTEVANWEKSLQFTYTNLPVSIRVVDNDGKSTSTFVPGKPLRVMLRGIHNAKFNRFVMEARQISDSTPVGSWIIPENTQTVTALTCKGQASGTLTNKSSSALSTLEADVTLPADTQIQQLEILAIVRDAGGKAHKFTSTEMSRFQKADPKADGEEETEAGVDEEKPATKAESTDGTGEDPNEEERREERERQESARRDAAGTTTTKKPEVAGGEGEEETGEEEEAAKPREETVGPTEDANEPERRAEQERKAAENRDKKGPSYQTSVEYERAQEAKQREDLRKSIDQDMRGSEDELTKKELEAKRRDQEEYRKEQMDAERRQSEEQRRREENYRKELKDWEEYDARKKAATTEMPEIDIDEKIVIIDENRGPGDYKDKETSGSAKIVVALATIFTTTIFTTIMALLL